MNPGERFFDLLLRLLPRRFRDRFGGEMHSTFRAEHAEAMQGGRAGPARFWAKLVASILTLAPREHFADLLLDLRFASRTLLRQPIFTVSATLSLAVGIGATATVIAVFAATFGRTAPGVEAPEALVNVKLKTASDDQFTRTSYPNYRDLRDTEALAGLAGFHGLRLSWATGDGEEAAFVFAQLVSDNYFSVLGTRALAGRLIDAEDERKRLPVAVISEQMWHNSLGGDAEVIGSTLRLNGRPFTIVGIVGDGYRGHFIGFRFDVFVPLSMTAMAALPDLGERQGEWVELVGRVHSNGSLEDGRTQARGRLEAAALHLAAAYPSANRGMEVKIERYDGFDADLRGGLAAFVAILFGVSTFVLLIACVNVANLMLSRVVRRRREMSLRVALGAPRSRLLRQLLTESVLIALIAGGFGALLAFWATGLARRAILSQSGGVSLDLRLDLGTLVAAIALSLGAALVFGLIPALRGSAGDQGLFLHGRGAPPAAGKLRGLMVVAQVALSLVILVTAGLFVRALVRADRLDPGFDTEGVLALQLNPTLAGMDAAAAAVFFHRLAARAVLEAGVVEAGLTDRLALGLGARFFANTVEVAIPGHPPPADRAGIAIEHAGVSPGYLATLGIPIQAGRGLPPQESPRQSGVAGSDSRQALGATVVNETFAERFFPQVNPLGQVLQVQGRPVEIIGIARDSRYRTLDETPIPFLYLPSGMTQPGSAILMLKVAAGSGDLAPRLRAMVHELAPDLPIGGIEQLETVLAVSFLPQKIAAITAGVMGLIGLFMVALGLYGVLSYSVTCRRAEIGVRLSLGASPTEILNMVLRQAFKLVLLGLLAGVPLAILTSRLLASFLYGLSPLDLVTYGLICTLMALTAVVAASMPARKAANIDPLSALRQG